ncbi:hypothetical protein [Sphingomonas sanxanigenens]|uniref:Uncharacterized protein n=1 Tax=Sphingomonas sanxanigenens DSM 19645 = NX02 TaxID=1123269 RepID=W0A8J7_9SPHN|nr:hypothetical protein [Sphingomonas sanxanigenens]AHE52648.1 hypothetical protein NX02_04520 [Sphingomonas sanxanigenens DSM 19645 = NX02]
MIAAFFGACVAIVLWRTWRFDALRPVAFALLAGYVEANAAAMLWPFQTRVILDIFAEVIVGMTTASAWITLRGRGGARAAPIIILSILNVCCAVSLSFVGASSDERQWLYVVLTNIFFLVQLLLVGFWGVKHARAGVARWGRRIGDVGPAPEARSHGG